MTRDVCLPDDLKKLRIFVVEDEVLILALIEDMLDEIGCTIAASASTVQQALRKMTDTHFDVAVLDVNLGDAAVFPVAEAMRARGLPIIFTTGAGSESLPADWKAWPVLRKPYQLAELAVELRAALAMKRASSTP
jgi:DNA-binding response OmpR family regulator